MLALLLLLLLLLVSDIHPFSIVIIRVLNPFIEKNSAAIQQLFAQLAVVPDVDINTCFAADSRGIFSDVGTSQLEDDVAMVRSALSACKWVV